MTEKIDWESLLKTINVWVETAQALPDDLYACPHCEGTGRIQVGHADPGPNPTIKCGMCNGTQIIKKCHTCQINPIPSDSRSCMCNKCETERLEHLMNIEKHTEICPTDKVEESE